MNKQERKAERNELKAEAAANYSAAAAEVHNEDEVTRKKVARLRKKQAKIEKEINALDRQSTLRWEIVGLYRALESASDPELESDKDAHLYFRERDVTGDLDVTYSHIDPEFYRKQFESLLKYGF